MQDKIIIMMALWLIYGFLGFLIETTYVSVLQKKFVQRGFLSGPIIPIYAFGATVIIFFLEDYHNVFVVFILGVLLTSSLEYMTHFLMEKFLHLKLWDYSNKKINLNGRICLLNSTLFGVLALSLVFIINPPIERFLLGLAPIVLNSFVSFGVILTALDFTLSMLAALNIKAHLKELSTGELNFDTEQFKEHFGELENKYKMVKKRLVNAYPDMRSTHLHEVMIKLKEKYRDR